MINLPFEGIPVFQEMGLVLFIFHKNQNYKDLFASHFEDWRFMGLCILGWPFEGLVLPLNISTNMTTTRNQPKCRYIYDAWILWVCSSVCIQVWNQINKEVTCNHLHIQYINHFSSTQGMVNLPAWVTIRLEVWHYPIQKGRRVPTIILSGAC